MARLHADEIEHYRREGWVVPRYRLPPTGVARMVQALERLLRDNPGVRPEKLVSAHIDGDNGEGVRGSSAFLDLAREPDIVELVSGVLGDDVILWGCHVFCKPAVEGYETPWHQDGHYWPIRPLATCTAWVALEPSTKQNGCLRVIPRSHAARRLHEHLHEERTDLTLNQRMAAGAFDEGQALDVELEPGQMSLHDVYMIHGAKPNTSGLRRTGAALRYMPATSVFERDLRPVDGKSGVPVNFARRPLWLVKGVDRSGRNDFSTGHLRMKVRVVAHLLASSGPIPNHPRWPLLVYPQAVRNPTPEGFEALFTRNGWPAAWRNGVFPFHHYHSNAHEALGIYEGEVTVQFGGEGGVEVTAGPGDVIVLPAGTGHKKISSRGTLGVVGAYPEGAKPDTCMPPLARRAKNAQSVLQVGLPTFDPVHGRGGPLFEHWRL